LKHPSGRPRIFQTKETEAVPRAILSRLAQRTQHFDFAVWFWGDAIAFDGLLDAAELLHEEDHALFCRRFLERWNSALPAWTDYLAPGLALTRLSRLGAGELASSPKRLLTHYRLRTPRGVSGLHYFRPDLPQFRTTILIDSLYHVPSFIAASAALSGDESLLSEAVAMWREHAEALTLPDRPLLFHNYDHGSGRRRGYGWGRGNGWALFGLLDLIEILPSGHPDRGEMVDRFRKLSAAILPLQDSSGFWRTLLSEKESYLETSTAAFFGAIFTKAVRLGLLTKEFDEAADRAWRALLSRIDDDGGAFGTSAAIWAANAPIEDLRLYKTAPTEVNVWGQGAALRFAAERIRAAQK
jgi:unsaturated rhamnogalacturonyl hydrolase